MRPAATGELSYARATTYDEKIFTVSLSRELERETFQLRLTPALELERQATSHPIGRYGTMAAGTAANFL